MEVGLLKIYQTFASRILDVSIPDIPFLRHHPVKYRRSGRHLVHLERDLSPDGIERLAHAMAGDAPAEWEQLGDEPMHLTAGLFAHLHGGIG